MNHHLKTIQTAVEAYCSENYHFGFDAKNPRVRLHEPGFAADDLMAMMTQAMSTMVTMGKEVREFEEQAAKRFDAKYCVMNNSGSSANLLAIAALANPAWPNHMKPGDEVIVPALSWATTVWPIIQHHLVPVFVDCDLETLNFDMAKLEAAIGPKTRAIMPVHVYGNPCDMDALAALCDKHKLYLIEDTCESMGATYKGRCVGSFGILGTMSTYYSHHITTFEGGLTFTNNFEMAELLRILRAHGWSREADEKDRYIRENPDIDPRFIFINIGYNLRPTEVQAAMGKTQLPKLSGFIERRRAAYARYRAGLDKYGDVLQFQQEQAGGQSRWFGFCARVKESAPFTLKDITGFLQSKGIETRPIIAGNMARHPALKMFAHRVSGSLENCDKVMTQGFAIGCHHAIDASACDYVIGCVDEFMQQIPALAAGSGKRMMTV